MLGALPPDDERGLEAQTETSFRGRAPGGPEPRKAQNTEFDRLGARLRRHRAEARGQGGLPGSADIDLAARRLPVLTGGLSAERVLYPGRVTAARQKQMLSELLGSLRRRPG